MTQKTDKLIKLANVLRKHESAGTKVKPVTLAKNTGYAISTIRTHFSKKLKDRFAFSDSKGKWYIRGMLKTSNIEFIQFMRQTNKTEVESEEQIFFKLLLKKSRDSFIVALESYNRPTLENRVEVFCILAVNAWELLLKGTLVNNTNKDAIYRDDGKSYSISECVNKLYSDKDPIRKNLEKIIELRDKAIHLLIPEIQNSLSRIFQSTVFNYLDAYRGLTGINPIAGQNTGLLSLVIDGSDADYIILKRQYGEDFANIIDTFVKDHNQLTKSLDSTAYSIPLNYSLTISKTSGEGDINLGTGSTGHSAIIISKTRDPSKTHPYRFYEFIKQVNKQCKKNLLTQFNFQAILYKHNIRSKAEYYFEFKSVATYSNSLIDWILKNSKQPNWLDSALESYRNRKKA